MARVKDLWHVEVKDPDDPNGERKIKQKTRRHPDNGGNKNAKRWLAVWIDPEGKEKTKAFRVQDVARKYAQKQEGDIERGEYIDAKDGDQLFGPLARKWLSLQRIGASSRVRYEGVLRLHIEPAFAERKVKAVKPSEIAAWMNDLTETHGYSVQAQAYFILSAVFTLAVADKIRRDNPAQSSVVPRPVPPGDEEPREAWTADRAWQVIRAHPAPYDLIPVLQAGCGMRQCEALAVAEEDFDFEAGKLTIQRQLSRAGKQYVFKLPKGGKTRTVPLPAGVARLAEAFIAKHRPRPYTLPWLLESGKLADEHTCLLLFRWASDSPKTNDQHIREWCYNRTLWKPALAAAGIIPEVPKGRRGGMGRKYEADRENGTHALRHYYSTTIQDAGVSLAGVMAFLGHSRKNKRNIPISVRVYGHVTEETFEAARNAVDRSLFRPRAVEDPLSAGAPAERAAAQ